MCTNVTHRATIAGSAKGRSGWSPVTGATIYLDHPFHAPFEHTLNIDLVDADGGRRVAIELSAASARELVRQIDAALAGADRSVSPD